MSAAIVTGLGLVTCVGHDAASACAAQRAGVVRRAPLHDLTAYDEAELEAPVMGAPIRSLTDGFIQTGNWIRTAVACLEDLERTSAAPADDAAFWADTALLWVVPEYSYERFYWPEPDVPRILESSCAQVLESVSGLRFHPLADRFVPLGHAGAAAAIQRALQLLAAQQAPRVAILSTDSWLDTLSLGVLGRQGRLHTPERSAGMTPGEGAAAILLESPAEARRRSARPQAFVLAATHRPAPRELAEDDPAGSRSAMAPEIARVLAGAARQVLGAGSGGGERAPDQRFRGDLVLDLNGEVWRAEVWGHLMVHLGKDVEFDGCRQFIPAVSWGDIGAASGLAGACIAARSYARGYAAASGRTLVLSVSDGGGVGAVLFGSP